MATFPIIKNIDVVKDIGTGLCAGHIDLISYAFFLATREERFHYSIVIAIAASAHDPVDIVAPAKAIRLY